jgi:hypothetical protein
MRLLLLLLLSFIFCSCQNLYTNIPKGTTSDESITQLSLDYRMLSFDKVIGTIQNNSERRILDVRVRINILNLNGSNSIEHFVIAKINPYQNYKFKKIINDVEAVEMVLEIQSSHY